MFRPHRVALLFVLLAAPLAAWLVASRSHPPDVVAGAPVATEVGDARSDPLASVPDDALLLLTLEVRALRKTAIGDRLLGRGRRIPGLGRLADVCGHDPLEGVDRLAFVVPARGGDGDFGVVATGRLDAEALLRCAKELISRRGGQPQVRSQGSFRLLREAGAAPGGAELAVALEGPAIVGPSNFLESATTLASSPGGPARNQEHLALRALVRPGVGVASVVLTDELRRTLVEELTAQGASDSPWAAATGAAVSLALEDRLRAELALRCEPAAACVALEREVGAALAARASRFAPMLPELAGALRAVRVEGKPGTLRISLVMVPERAVALVEELLVLSEISGRASEIPPRPSSTRSQPAPD